MLTGQKSKRRLLFWNSFFDIGRMGRKMYRYRSRILRYLIQFYRIGVLICGIFARIYGPR